jgi:hypothetical protein
VISLRVYKSETKKLEYILVDYLLKFPHFEIGDIYVSLSFKVSFEDKQNQPKYIFSRVNVTAKV